MRAQIKDGKWPPKMYMRRKPIIWLKKHSAFAVLIGICTI